MSNTNIWDVLVITAYLLFRLAVFGGAAYLVEVHDWSLWTFALAAAIGAVKVEAGH